MSAVELCDGKRCEVSSSTSHSVHYPPSAVSDGVSSTFWSSTGLYPQELTIGLNSITDIKRIEFISCGIKSVQILKGDSLNSSANNSWEIIYSQKKCDDSDGEIQILTPDIPSDIRTGYIKIKILSGYYDICNIYKVSIIGTQSDIGNPAKGKNTSSAYLAAGSLSSRLGSMSVGSSGSGNGEIYNGSPTHAGHAGRHK
jgi:hypothetical protein